MEETLLKQFAQTRDEQAFVALVNKYGPLVLGVCRRVLGSSPDAEDAAQAVFLTLAQKSAALSDVVSLEAWLHHVAWQVALDARKLAQRRRKHEQEAAVMKARELHRDPPDESELPWLDQEIDALPKKYRLPVILHHLRGHTQEETARLLNENAGTIAARLNRGREMLRMRLAQRGHVLSIGAIFVFAPETVHVPAAFAAATAKGATLLAAGQSASPGLLSTQTQILIKGAMKMLIWEKIRVAAALVVLACAGSLLLAVEAGPAPGDSHAEAAPPAKTGSAEAQAFDNALSLSGQTSKPHETAFDLGYKDVLVIRSAERWKHIQDELVRFGWEKSEKNPLAGVDFSRQTIFGAANCNIHGEICRGMKCDAVRGDANKAEIEFKMECVNDMDFFAAPKFHFAFVAIPNSKIVKVLVSAVTTLPKPKGDGSTKTFLEWSGEFGVQRGDWVSGLSATIEPDKAAISVGDDIRVKFTLSHNNTGWARQSGFFTANSMEKSATVWDGKYSNGYANHSMIVERPDGKTVWLQVPVISEWDKNAPHPVEITADNPYVLPGWTGDASKSLNSMIVRDTKAQFKADQPGTYKITGIYHETGSNDYKMWGGSIASNTATIEVKQK